MVEMEISYVASALVMGALLLGIGAAIARGGYVRPSSAGENDRAEAAIDALARAARDPTAWTLSFVLGTIVIGASVLLYVGGLVPEGSQRAVGLAIAGLLSATFAAFLFVGTYLTARSKGRSTAWGVAEGITALGLLFILAIVGTLVVG